jgi:FixJ family two-component response regulator
LTSAHLFEWPASERDAMIVLGSAIPHGTVYVQKRCPAERDAIGAVLEWAGIEAHPVESFSDVLTRLDHAKPACLITDLPTFPRSRQRFEGLSLEDLDAPVEPGGTEADSHTLVICAACLTEAGCTFREENLCFLKRPFARGQLLEAIVKTLSCDLAHQERSRQHAHARERIATLTPREHQVMDLIYDGLPNKTIAGQLSLSTRTVEASRAAVYRKLGVDSGIGLVRLLARMEYEVAARGELGHAGNGTF